MAALYRLNRALIRVSGPDASGFLNNLLTQNLDGLSEAQVRYGALLSPQGKIIADMFLWALEDGLALEVDPTRVADLMRRLGMYKLRANVKLSDAQDLIVAWSAEAFEGAADDPRLALLGARKLIGAGDGAQLLDGTDAYDAHRLRLGVPDLARDVEPETIFALEALLEELNGVDFQKGCFPGQENVSRMKRRATTRRKLCPILFNGEAPPLGTPVTAGDVEIGTVRTGGAGRALALLRLDRAQEASVAGVSLTAAGKNVHLDPPSWLILPNPAGEGD